MRDTREPRLDGVPPGGTLNIVDRVGPSLRNSVRKADFDLLVLQTSMGLDEHYIFQPEIETPFKLTFSRLV
jgi:hypothetical protein